MRITVILGYGGSYVKIFREILGSLSSRYAIQYIIATDDEEPTNELINFIRSSDAILLYVSRLNEEMVEAIKNSSAKIILSFSESFQELSRGSQILAEAWRYFKLGGRENIKGLLELVLSNLGLDIKPSPPQEIPWHGIWHPELGVYMSTREYLRSYPYANRPLVALIFYRSRWLIEDTKVIEALVKTLETEGLGVIPIFTYGFRDYLLNTPTVEDSLREFLILEGRSIVDLVVILTSFFVLDHGKWFSNEYRKRFSRVESVELLNTLNTPIIKPVIEHHQSIEEWLSNSSGISSLTQVYHVIMPEVDGAIEPVFIAGVRKDEYGSKIQEPFEPHVKYIAKRIKKWIELRRTPPQERRIAIVLNNPPCRGVEASIGVGLGLDVPETIVRLLHKLREYGYDVGDPSRLPKSGTDLMKIFLERRATSEFRWTSIDDIVRRGGYVDMVPMDLYMQWFNELPEVVREELIREWGDPRDLSSGKIEKIFAGGLYNGNFIVPGIRFGNVVIIPQPKFGCAGAGCDGRICKILHDPKIPPPHQWLAVYRWITRVFKAHLILHVGTHGTLEFRPGKNIGLSPYCWPEISLDDVPLLYIYIVSNPMEGVIAKRRSYAVIIDHIYPPMMDARGGLEELDRLLEEYEKISRLGESHRSKIIYDQIISKVKELGLPIDPSIGREDFLSNLHRYLDTIRSSQVENGLHIFGETIYEPEKLSRLIATIMEFDTVSWRSILRSVADYLGVNYDEILSNPGGYCDKLKMSNRKVKELLMEISQRVLKRLIEMGIDSSSLTNDLLENILNNVISEVILDGSRV